MRTEILGGCLVLSVLAIGCGEQPATVKEGYSASWEGQTTARLTTVAVFCTGNTWRVTVDIEDEVATVDASIQNAEGTSEATLDLGPLGRITHELGSGERTFYRWYGTYLNVDADQAAALRQDGFDGVVSIPCTDEAANTLVTTVTLKDAAGAGECVATGGTVCPTLPRTD